VPILSAGNEDTSLLLRRLATLQVLPNYKLTI